MKPLSPEARRLIVLLLWPLMLTALAISCNSSLFGINGTSLLFQGNVGAWMPSYNPFHLHKGDALVTLWLAAVCVWVAGAPLLATLLFSLLYGANIFKLYVLNEHLTHHDAAFLSELWHSVNWPLQLVMVAAVALLILAIRYSFSRRLWQFRLAALVVCLLPLGYSAYQPQASIDWLQAQKLIRKTDREPYVMAVFNGPVIAVLIYEINYFKLMEDLAAGENGPRILPPFDFRHVAKSQIVKRPNIYVILLESFLDPGYFSAVQMTPPALRGNMKTWSDSGNSAAFFSVRSTAAVEFEVLCGLPNQMAYAPRIFNFLLKPNASLECLPHFLKDLGYHTAATHPNIGAFYNRDKAYPALGFDEMHFAPDLDMRDRDTVWLTDESLLKQNLEWVKKQLATGKPFLNYVMTTGGHYPYDLSETHPKMLAMTPDIKSAGAKSLQISYYTIGALNEYTAELRKLDPSALIVMMGDHFPYFIDGGDRLIQWQRTQGVAAHPLYDTEHQAFGMVLENGKPLALKPFEQFDLANILVNRMTNGAWCNEQRCLQDEPYMLVGTDIRMRAHPGLPSCSDDSGDEVCERGKRMREIYRRLYRSMLFPFFS